METIKTTAAGVFVFAVMVAGVIVVLLWGSAGL